MVIIETDRLILRTWKIKEKDNDLNAYYRINQDLKVIEFLAGPLSMDQVEAFMLRNNQQQQQRGFALWAVELKNKFNINKDDNQLSGNLMGFIGLNYINWQAHFTPAVEIGWRLGSQYWGHGYATEGAKAALDYGFETIQLNEIVSFAVPGNVRSIRVMEKLGMKRDLNGDFSHPNLPVEHKLSRHILYRLNK